MTESPEPHAASATAPGPLLSSNAQSLDATSWNQHFGGVTDLLPLWIAEPYVPISSSVTDALQARAATGWYGYETRPDGMHKAFWSWMTSRHHWHETGLRTHTSPSVGTSIAVLIEHLTEPGDAVLVQPPVFTDFKTLVASADRRLLRNSLQLTDTGYRMDLDDLAVKAAEPATTAMILCNPHNPVGRVWTEDELGSVAEICAEHNVFVLADEIHADLALGSNSFTPFGSVARQTNVRWAAMHGPIKTFGLAGVCDTLIVTNDEQASERFESSSSRLHLTRNNVFALSAFQEAYTAGEAWLEELLGLVEINADLLRASLPPEIGLVDLEGTYLAWLDLRALRMDASELARWLAEEAHLALSPGHWFGREGAGFARMTIAAPTEQIQEAIDRLHSAVAGLR